MVQQVDAADANTSVEQLADGWRQLSVRTPQHLFPLRCQQHARAATELLRLHDDDRQLFLRIGEIGLRRESNPFLRCDAAIEQPALNHIAGILSLPNQLPCDILGRGVERSEHTGQSVAYQLLIGVQRGGITWTRGLDLSLGIGGPPGQQLPLEIGPPSGTWMLRVPHGQLVGGQSMVIFFDHRLFPAQLQVLVEPAVHRRSAYVVIVVIKVIEGEEFHIVGCTEQSVDGL